LVAVTVGLASTASAQTLQSLPLLADEATPVGALPPMALPMPASRDQNYWGLRLQVGERQRRSGPEDLLAVGAGVDYQIAGGSILGFTGGYQRRQHCQPALSDCRGHSLFGLRGRFNVITGGPTVAGIIGDESAASTLGTEIGFGYAPKVSPGVNACTLDLGVPISVAMLQTIRVVTFITPGADPYSLFALAIPLYVLYEVSVFVAQFAYRKRQKREAKRDAEDAAEHQSAGAPA